VHRVIFGPLHRDDGGIVRKASRSGSPPARVRSVGSPLARVIDPRVIIGVILMALSVLVGLRVSAPDGTQVALVAAVRDLPSGAVLGPTDVKEIGVGGVGEDAYLSTAAQAAGRQLRHPVGAGQLIPAAALQSQTVARLVAVPMDVERLSAPLQRGAVVDVWATSAESAGARLVIRDALVDEVVSDTEWGGSTGTVVLRLPGDDVQAVVSASREGDIDLVPVVPGVEEGAR